MRPSALSCSPDELWSLIEEADPKHLSSRGGIESLARDLCTDLSKGIDKSVPFDARSTKYGKNILPDRPVRSFSYMLMAALKDQTILILMTCAIVSLILEFLFAAPEDMATCWIDGTAILLAVAIVSVVQAETNYKQEMQFAAVNRIKSIYGVAVIREGKVVKILNTDLLVGDVVCISQGDRIPADGILISADELKIDQSTASGESEAVLKGSEDPFLISNTHVTEGIGTFLVTCVGVQSHHGRVFALLTDELKPTPLQIKLESLAQKIGIVGVLVAALSFLALLFPWIGKVYKTFTFSKLQEPLQFFIVAITIVACAVPEGLPLAVTISLAYSMRQMMDDNNFVRRLSACETMGSATVICTDKTGTLTLNEMNVERILVGNRELVPSELNDFPDLSSSLSRSLAVNSHALLADGAPIGSQTECALLRLVTFLGQDYLSIRASSTVAKCFQFDRKRKMMSTVIRQNNRYSIMTKGAPDEIIKRCSLSLTLEGKLLPIDRSLALSAVDSQCDRAYRTLAVAYRDSLSIPQNPEEAESDLTLLCVLSIRDTIRPSAKKAIEDCHRAGLRVIMVTGDHAKTAAAVARELNIPGELVTGSEIRNFPRETLRRKLEKVGIVARSTPVDKHIVVTALQEDGEVVGVTGDGTNDVPALMAADVGLAMGKSGTELAKEASDIVVLDDDFRSIVKSVIWGRGVYNNIRRFLQFQLTANAVTLFVNFMAAVFLNDTPFKAVQLLWVNLIMDSLGALALSTGKPSEHLLDQQPPGRGNPMISPFMTRNIVIQSVCQVLALVAVTVWPGDAGRFTQRHYTLLFNVFVLLQATNLLNVRVVEPSDKFFDGLFENKLFFAILSGIFVSQFILVQFGGGFFGCIPLSVHEWVRCVALASLSLPAGTLSRSEMWESIGQRQRFQRLN